LELLKAYLREASLSSLHAEQKYVRSHTGACDMIQECNTALQI